MSLNLAFDQLEKIILLVWDESSNFNSTNTQLKIGKDLFKDVKLIENLEKLKSVFDSFSNDQEFLFLIHLFHNEDNKGYYKFKNSKILKEFPKLRYYIISSAPKKSIYENEDNNLDVYTYDGFHEKIGTTFLPQKKSDIISIANDPLKLENRSDNKKSGIFLSHSSKDRQIVEKFRDIILEGGLNVPPDKIKFTSVEDHGLPGGINISENLKEFLKSDMGLFIQFLSKDYEASRVCVNEEGAAWCLLDDLYFISIFLPPANSKNISWVKTLNKGISIDKKESLLNLYENRKFFFNSNVNITRFHNKIDEFLEFYQKV